MKEIKLKASLDNMDDVLRFVEDELDRVGSTERLRIQMDVAVEEVFVNIASYAYGESSGDATVIVDFDEDPKAIRVTFIDSGIPYNPLEKEDPDITLSSEERQIGGLGIYMVKKSMDDMLYEYKDGQNILTIVKRM